MSVKLKKQLQVELEQLNLLLNRHPGLLEKCRTKTPTAVEVDAVAVLLHSFYTGVENIFKRVNVAMGDDQPGHEFWHIRLLNGMTRATPARPVFISEELRAALRGYLDFRHAFRHAYSFELRWSKMAPLALEVEGVLRRLEAEVGLFLQAIESEQGQ